MNLNFIKKALPFLGTAVAVALPGPIGVAAGILTKVLGPKDPIKADANSIGAALEAALGDPALVEKAKEAEQQFQLALQQMNLNSIEELEQIAAADRASARQREQVVKDLMPKILGMGVMSGFITATFLVLTGHAKADSVMAGTLIGYLSAKAELVLAYYFGSSAGSDRKTELMANGNGHS